MTNSERAAADQRLMDAMVERESIVEIYSGRYVWVDRHIRTYGDFDFLTLESARTLHRELGEALAAIEAQFGEKPPAPPPLDKCDAEWDWYNRRKRPAPMVPPECTGPGAPCGCSIHSAAEPLKPTFTMNYPKPEDAPGARETIWGSWSDSPTVAK